MPKSKHFVIGLDPRIVDEAERRCRRRGTTLRKVVDSTIIEQSKLKDVPDEQAFILESDAINEIWCPSRATLFVLRRDKKLKEGKLNKRGVLTQSAHYYTLDTLVFYNYARLRDFCREHYPQIEQANLKETAVAV